MADKREPIELKEIASLKELTFEGNTQELDLTEDAWEFGAPPKHDIYDVKWVLGKDGFKVGQSDPKDPRSIFLQAAMEGVIKSNDPEIEGIPVYGRLTTRIYRGKNISTMAGFIVKAGYGATLDKMKPLNDKKIAQVLEAVLKKEPIVKTELDWRGSYSWTDQKGNDQWENVFNSWSEFPNDPEKPGAKQHIVRVAVPAAKGGGTAEVRAMLNVVKFYGKGDALPNLAAKAQGLVSAPRTPQPLTPAVTPAISPTMVMASPSVPVVSSPQVQTEDSDSLELMLAD